MSHRDFLLLVRRISWFGGVQNGKRNISDLLHFFTLFRSVLKMLIWTYAGRVSNRPKVQKN